MRTAGIRCVAFGMLVLCCSVLAADEAKPIALPKPQTDGGKPLMQALRERRSMREFSSRKLSDQVLSNLLWAADGINRPDSGKRTAPSAMNWQNIDIYVATEDGLFLYDAAAHALTPILNEDIRALTGSQSFVKEAPLNLVYVADNAKIKSSGPIPDAQKDQLSAADTGFISQNVYLFCASEGLGTVVRGMVPVDDLARKMNLRPEQKIILAQTVGYTKEK